MDVTGEPSFIRASIMKHNARATADETYIVHACGCVWWARISLNSPPSPPFRTQARHINMKQSPLLACKLAHAPMREQSLHSIALAELSMPHARRRSEQNGKNATASHHGMPIQRII